MGAFVPLVMLIFFCCKQYEVVWRPDPIYMLRCRACVHSSIAAVCASDATFYCRETSYSGCTASALPCQSASGANSRCSICPSWYLPSVTNTGVNASSGQFSFEADRKDRGIGSLPTLLNTSRNVRCYRLRCVYWLVNCYAHCRRQSVHSTSVWVRLRREVMHKFSYLFTHLYVSVWCSRSTALYGPPLIISLWFNDTVLAHTTVGLFLSPAGLSGTLYRSSFAIRHIQQYRRKREWGLSNYSNWSSIFWRPF